MKIKKNIIAASSLAIAGSLAFASTPAFAVPFDDPQIINGLEIGYDSNGFGHVYEWDAVNMESRGDTTTHAAGQIRFTDSFDSTTNGVCNEETAVLVDEPDGDVVITCDAQALSGGLEGLTVAPQYRFYNLATPNMVMTRMLYSVSNTTNSDITVPQIKVSYNWDEYDDNWDMLTNNGTVIQDTVLTGTSTRWLNTATYSSGSVDPSYTTFGAAWHANGNSFFNGFESDLVSSDYIEPSSEDVVIPANSTVMLAFFALYGSAGDGATPDETTAFMTVLDAQFAVFNEAFTSSSILAKGIPMGSNVLNWGILAPAPEPALADTGVDTASAYGVLLMAGLLLAAGTVFALRRRA